MILGYVWGCVICNVSYTEEWGWNIKFTTLKGDTYLTEPSNNYCTWGEHQMIIRIIILILEILGVLAK